MTDRTPALMAALSVALRARQGLVDPAAVDEAVRRAQDLLPQSDPGRAGILLFAACWRSHRHDAGALAELGDQLHHAVITASRPVPVDLHRSDIHG